MSMFRPRAAAINAWRMERAKAQELLGHDALAFV
jgi:hypothetical protein